MFPRKSPQELHAGLDAAEAAIAAHPFSSEEVVRAHAVIESVEVKDKDVVSARLAEEGLPDMVELGLITARHTVSWWKLHRDRRKILAALDGLADR
jgi:hypothetical protein